MEGVIYFDGLSRGAQSVGMHREARVQDIEIPMLCDDEFGRHAVTYLPHYLIGYLKFGGNN